MIAYDALTAGAPYGGNPVVRTVSLLLVPALAAGILVLALDREPERAAAGSTTVSTDSLRTGWDPDEPGLAPASVTSSDFGRLWDVPVDGQVYAQPVAAGPVVVAVTEADKAYGVDPATGAVRWTRDVGPAWPASAIGCGDLTPSVGATATPVYDPSTGTVYFSAKVADGPDVYHPHWHLHAVDAATGAERAGWPVTIQGAPVNEPGRPFNPFTAMQRPGLLLLDGRVYLGFASHCDYPPYVGYVAGVDTASRAVSLWSTESGATSDMGGIWQSGGGLVSDGPGRILLTTGNGVSPPVGPGSPVPGQLAESVVRLSVAADGTMTARDFFSPGNATKLDQDDSDLGSGGPVALPSSFGASAHPRLLVQIGKDGRLLLLDRDDLGGRSQGVDATDDVVSQSGPYRGVWGHPAVFGGAGGWVYTIGNGDPLRAFSYGVTGSGVPVLAAAGNSPATFGYTSGSPVVTSTGTDPSTALVWAVSTSGPTGADGRLQAYDAIPVDGVLRLRWSAPIGQAAKFAVPATDGGRVFVGTRDGHLYAYGRPTTAALTGSPVRFGSVPVGSSGSATASLTAARPVTVSSAAVPAPFSVSTAGLPKTLAAGATLTLPVTYAPTSPGAAVGTLTLTLADGSTLGVDLSGTATRDGFTAGPASVDFEGVPVGAGEARTVNLTNTGTGPETVLSSSGPGAPFAVEGLPAAGTVVPAGGVMAVSVLYTPTAAGSDSGTVTVQGDHGPVSIALTGTAVSGSASLSLEPDELDFGSVPLGSTKELSFDVTDEGNLPLTITKAAPPAAPFGTASPLPEGLTISPEDTLHQSVSFTPTELGDFTGTYLISADDGGGARAVSVRGRAVPATGVALPQPGGGWTVNGAAAMRGTDLVLTPSARSVAGSAVAGAAVPSGGLHARFTAVLGGGTGGDGMTFALLDPAAGATAVGGPGGAKGLGGLTGTAVVLDTYRNTGEPSSSFVAVATSSAAGLRYLAMANTPAPLRTGAHVVDVTAGSGRLAVSVDGVALLSTAVPVAASVLPAFTGGTGTGYDVHTVWDVTITAGGRTLPVPGGGWSWNGSARPAGPVSSLTGAAADQAGSTVYPTPLVAEGLSVHLTARLGASAAGVGADGIAVALLDPAAAGPTALGGLGGAIGVGGIGGGLPGAAVTLDTYQSAGEVSDHFAGIATSYRGGKLGYIAVTKGLPPLRGAPHTLAVTYAAGLLRVSVDGLPVLSKGVALPPAVRLAITSSTGAVYDVHSVSDVAVAASAYADGPGRPGLPAWSLGGYASRTGEDTVLTPALVNRVGSTFSGTAVTSGSLHARFTAQLSGGTGADGLAFVLLDASSPKRLGGAGAGLGFGGLPGVAVTLDTNRQTGEPSANFMGVAVSSGTAPIRYVAYRNVTSSLRAGTHLVDVVLSPGGRLRVWLDGTGVLDTTVQVPARILPGFTAGNGSRYDVHAVRGVTITP